MYTLNEDGESYTAHGYGPATGLKNIVIPTTYEGLPVTAIADFSHGPLENIYIPEGVVIIDNNAFANCSKLKSITVPSTVSVINHGVFMNCTALETVTLYEGIVTIFDDAFQECSSLKNITIPETVDYI